MSARLDPLQTLLIFRLIFTGETPKLSELQPQLKPVKRRDELVTAGLLKLEKRGRATYVFPTEKARDWTAHHLDADFSLTSTSVGPTLKAVMEKMHGYLSIRGVSLCEFLRPGESTAIGAAREETELTKPARPPEQLSWDMVRAAYTRLTGGRWNIRVRLSDLRDQLSEFTREVLDGHLLTMQKLGMLALYSLDDPQEISRADREAALSILGHRRHIVYMSGVKSVE